MVVVRCELVQPLTVSKMAMATAQLVERLSCGIPCRSQGGEGKASDEWQRHDFPYIFGFFPRTSKLFTSQLIFETEQDCMRV